MKKRTGKATKLVAAVKSQEDRIARWVLGIYCIGFFMALCAWILAPFRKGRSHTWWELTFSYLNVPVNHSLVSVIIMAVISSALLRRRRIGLYAVIFFEGAGLLLSLPPLAQIFLFQDQKIFAHLYNPAIDILSVILALCAIPLLISIRQAFPARMVRTQFKSLSLSLGLGLLISLALAFVFGFIHTGQESSQAWAQGLAYALAGLGIHLPQLAGSGQLIPPFQTMVDLAYAATLLVTLFFILRAPKNKNQWSPEAELELRQLIQQYGQEDSLAYFATRREKSVVYSDDRRAAVTFRVINSVSLASADPIGLRSSWPSAIKNWKEQARTYGWNIGVISMSEAGAQAFAAAGLSIIYMGEEATLVTDHFSLNNTSISSVRHAKTKLSKEGYRLVLHRQKELSFDQLKELSQAAQDWRQGQVERGFSMALNRQLDPADGNILLASAYSPTGQLVGLLSFVPWGRSGISLDLMRRSPHAPNGTVEFMIASLMEQAQEWGIKKVSLNFAMFRRTFVEADHFGASPWTKLAASTLGFFDRYLQLERLYRFNQKFDPLWTPRYLAAESIFTLAQVALAGGVAEGFLPDWPFKKEEVPGQVGREMLEKIEDLERKGEEVRLDYAYSDQTRHRIRHLNLLRQAGMDPYPPGLSAQYTTGQLAQLLAGEQAIASDQQLTVWGRVRSIRRHGSVIFLDLLDAGHRAQVVFERSAFAGQQEAFDLLDRAVDSADILVITGRLGYSRSGTASLLASGWSMAAKSLQALPFERFTDPEARLRRRSTDLIVNPKQRDYLSMRTDIVGSLRRTLAGEGFTEVETPILNPIHGGASARPFKTFINAYGADLYLRIAPELYLKRLVIGGMGAVYELGRNFRNEGADATHNPEFTVLEAYRPFADYHSMRQLTERLIKDAARQVFGAEQLPLRKKNSCQGQLQSISGPWPVKTVSAALSEALGRQVSLQTDFETLLYLARQQGIHVREDMGPGAILEELYSELVEEKTIFPTFYTDFPVETSPLAAPHRSVPGLAERWDLVINGMEVGTAYSEMADPLEQRRRLTEQSLKAAAGDPEAMELDQDFLYALETGLPPTGGLGLGIDRLVMLMTGSQIRSVLTFPFVKPSS